VVNNVWSSNNFGRGAKMCLNKSNL